MPSVSEPQRRLMALAEHNPSKVYKANRGVLKMSHKQLHDFAATKGITKKDHGFYGHFSPNALVKRIIGTTGGLIKPGESSGFGKGFR